MNTPRFLFNDLLLFRRHQKQILQKVEDIRMSNRLPKVLAEKPHQLCVDFLNGRTLSFACLTAEDASTLLELLRCVCVCVSVCVRGKFCTFTLVNLMFL